MKTQGVFRVSELRSGVVFAVLCAFSALGSGCSTSLSVRADPTIAALATPTLRTFRDMAEFDAYRARVREVGKGRNVYWSQVQQSRAERILLAQSVDEPCDPTVMECGPPDQQTAAVAVTAQRASSGRTSITNNQESEVDEGDIVKQYGRFLIILQDGRLFSIDTGAQAADLQLADRINIYSSADAETWYDELLIHDNHLVVTGYNYKEDATEINVISISAAGKLALEARYYLQSEDYYSSSNYASRLVRGQFVIYTPVDISADEPLSIPRIRSWTADGGFSPWQPLFDITEVYLPIQDTLTPMLHVVSVCSVGRRESFSCNSRGIVGPTNRELYVSGNNAYLWLTSDFNDWAYGYGGGDMCPDGADLYRYPALPAAVFQLPFAVDTVRAVHTNGAPPDQFAFDERDETLLALLVHDPQGCYADDAAPFMFASIPLRLFASSPATLGSHHVVRVRDATYWRVQSRYTKDYLLYGSAEGSEQYPNAVAPNEITVVPLARPADFRVLRTGHAIERLEVIGDNAVAFGSTDESGLGVSTVELRTRPRIASVLALDDIEESEGRSHAFNAIVDDDGSGTFGLPTVYRSKATNSWTTLSDVQFFSIDRRLDITPAGELAGQDDEDEDYECEVSCYEWYGNARPIFLEGRVFALTGSELIEGEIRSGIMVEIGRLRMTAAPGSIAAASLRPQ